MLAALWAFAPPPEKTSASPPFRVSLENLPEPNEWRDWWSEWWSKVAPNVQESVREAALAAYCADYASHTSYSYEPEPKSYDVASSLTDAQLSSEAM